MRLYCKPMWQVVRRLVLATCCKCGKETDSTRAFVVWAEGFKPHDGVISCEACAPKGADKSGVFATI